MGGAGVVDVVEPAGEHIADHEPDILQQGHQTVGRAQPLGLDQQRHSRLEHGEHERKADADQRGGYSQIAGGGAQEHKTGHQQEGTQRHQQGAPADPVNQL